MKSNKYNKLVMLSKYFFNIFFVDYNLISFKNYNHIRTRAVFDKCTPA